MATNSNESISKQIQGWMVTSLTVLFGLQLIRVLLPSFVGYLRDSQGVGSLDLAPIAIGIFSLSFLAGVIWKLAGPRNAVWISAGGVGLIRFVEQISTSPNTDYLLSAIGTALFLMFIPIRLGIARPMGTQGTVKFGFAFLIGMSLDTAIHIAAQTLDLSWWPGFIPILLVALLMLEMFDSLRKEDLDVSPDISSDGNWGRTFALAALGPWIFLQLIVFQNVARISALTGWETPAAGALVVFGNALGLFGAAQVARSGLRTFGASLIAGLILVASLLNPEATGWIAVLQLLGGHIFSIVIAMILFIGLGWEATKSGLMRASVVNGVGQILFVLLTFVYYVSFDISLGLRAQTLLPITAVLVAMGAVIAGRGQITYGDVQLNLKPAYAAGLLLVVPLGLAFTWGNPAAISPPSSNKTIRVMTYNLHNGFNTAGRLDLEAIAQVIEDSGADVVGFQEISRGWLIWAPTDMLTWLSQRLDMPYMFNPTADAQWGNAILSRYPIDSYEQHDLPPEDLLLMRGYFTAEINVGGGTFTMIGTHFSHRDNQDAERDIQASEIISAIANNPTTIFLGDLNARPDSNAYRILLDAGLIDISAILGDQPTYTYYSAYPDHQIDYIWATDDLTFTDFEIIQSMASDHLPLVVTIEIP
ncbi:MAG: hypothetical protein FVQ83_04825 [Chloroflexi bacterium]|nr:hypothetical protein [Chloroflexota bacterium]